MKCDKCKVFKMNLARQAQNKRTHTMMYSCCSNRSKLLTMISTQSCRGAPLVISVKLYCSLRLQTPEHSKFLSMKTAVRRYSFQTPFSTAWKLVQS